jgi:hypothetical protein
MRLVAGIEQCVDEIAADKARTADDCYFHCVYLSRL